MSTALRALLVRLREENKINKLAGRNERIVRHRTARRCLETACSKLKFPAFTHRAMRHFFATCAIESAVDIPTVSRWLGHKDGGALAMRVYGLLRGAHSDAMIGQVSFGVSRQRLNRQSRLLRQRRASNQNRKRVIANSSR